MNVENKFDFIIFGASGFTGKLVVESGATFNASCSMNKDGKKAEIQLVSGIEETREKTA